MFKEVVMSLDVLKYNDVDIIKLSGKLDVNTVVPIEGEVLSFVDSVASKVVLFDTLEAQYISASAMHLFLGVKEIINRKNIKVGIISSDIIKNIFSTLGIDNSFKFYSDIESACNDIKN